MANICEFEMRIKGTPENVDRLNKILFDYCGCYEADDDTYYEDENTKIISIDGSCRWSVETSFWSEARDGKNLEVLSKETNTTIEIYSEEEGMEFEEHYVVENGERIVCESDEITIMYPADFDSLEEFNKNYYTSYTPSEWKKMKNKEYVKDGGFKRNFSYTKKPSQK